MKKKVLRQRNLNERTVYIYVGQLQIIGHFELKVRNKKKNHYFLQSAS